MNKWFNFILYKWDSHNIKLAHISINVYVTNKGKPQHGKYIVASVTSAHRTIKDTRGYLEKRTIRAI